MESSETRKVRFQETLLSVPPLNLEAFLFSIDIGITTFKWCISIIMKMSYPKIKMVLTFNIFVSHIVYQTRDLTPEDAVEPFDSLPDDIINIIFQFSDLAGFVSSTSPFRRKKK
jgi:hypothetical protein